jgi:hypothetical protein
MDEIGAELAVIDVGGGESEGQTRPIVAIFMKIEIITCLVY